MSKKLTRSLMAISVAAALVLFPSLAMASPAQVNDHFSNGDNGGGSPSNPDGVGVDKPYGADGKAAGSQGSSYFDGNNGCGQDKHSGEARETGTTHLGWDDNNGWCGKPPFAGRSSLGDGGPVLRSGGPAQVLGATFTRPEDLSLAGVLGAVAQRGAPLAATGLDVGLMAALGIALIAVGSLVVSNRPTVART